jgi:MFS family permease
MRGALALLRDRPQFRALWAALALSYTGSGAALTALTLYVQQTRGTGTAVAALMIAETAPRLLGPLAGGLADRVDLRRLMIAADVSQAAIFAALAWLPPFAAILALGALATTLQTIYAPARTVAVPALVEDSELLRANSLLGGAANLYVALGPLLGGLLFAAGGAAAVMALNAATFLLSALLTRTIPPLPPHDRERAGEREPFLSSAGTGLRHALANPVTRAITLTITFMFAFLAIDNVALVFLVRDTLGGGATAYGLISAAFGAGMLLGSLGIMRGSRLAAPRLYLLGILLSSLGALLTGIAPALFVAAAIQVISGSGNGIEIVAGDTAFQQGVPRHLLGRVYGLTATAVGVGSGVAMALGGFLVDATSPRIAFLVSGAGGLLVIAIAAPALLQAGRPDDARLL